MKTLMQIFIISSLVLMVRCEKEDYNIHFPKVNEYRIKSMFYPTWGFPDTNKVKVIYNNKNKIIQRIGNLIPTSMMSKFYKYIGDTVKYYKDSIIIEKQLLSKKDFTGFTYPHKRKLFLENGLITKEINKVDYYSYGLDSTFYHYNKQKQIDQTTYFQGVNKKISNFKYSKTGNLISIVSEVYWENYSSDIQKIYADTAWFLDYDNSPNLAKDLIIFQECFYRAISTNNFKKYVYKRYSSSDLILQSEEERSWEITYDENNFPIY